MGEGGFVSICGHSAQECLRFVREGECEAESGHRRVLCLCQGVIWKASGGGCSMFVCNHRCICGGPCAVRTVWNASPYCCHHQHQCQQWEQLGLPGRIHTPLTPPRVFLMEEELGEVTSKLNSSSIHLFGGCFPNRLARRLQPGRSDPPTDGRLPAGQVFLCQSTVAGSTDACSF